ncbi:mobilisation protein (MobC) [Butyrivibrio fibrisolvens]|uniref:Mobilisation protein (MobC) n=1 Tax=Butyrivibrio fibrisolvens TaxID=831 RepID=A0A1H9VHL8_BUTFI|nr:plasmid mobilization relaxosome protein MobC [Butyrivibrio fibrisolvens]SES21041.1 mobilisation protein (MobC) [Butyrivibrio fibrisolvens]
MRKNGVIRNKETHVRFTEEEWELVHQLAEDFEMPLADFIRWSVFQRKVTMRILIDDESSALSKIRYQLDKIGANINQISKVLNSGFVNPTMFREELKSMFAEIHGQIDLLNRIQSENNSRWKTAVSKYSRYYQFDKTIGAEKDGNDKTSGNQG